MFELNYSYLYPYWHKPQRYRCNLQSAFDAWPIFLGGYTEFIPMLALLVLLLAPPDPQFQARVREGLAALEKNDPAGAQKSLELAARLDPSSAQVWFLLTRAYEQQNNRKAALAAADKAGRFAGKDAAILYNLALFYLDAGLPDPAIQAGKRALGVEKSYEVRNLLGRAYSFKRDWPNAIAQYREAQRLAPFSEEAYFLLAQAHLQALDFPGAIAVLEQSHKTFDKSPQLELALGVAYYGARRFPEAVDRFLRVMELAPDIPQPYYFLGRVLEHASERLPEVLARAEIFEKRHPQSPIGYVLHARALILHLSPSGYPDEARLADELIGKAIAIKEDQAEPHYLKALLLERQGDYTAAARELERSIAINDKDPQPHFRLARIYERLGRTEEAAAQRALHEKLSADSPKDLR